MPEKETIERAREDERRGKSPSTQAGEFVREEIEHVRKGKHGARSSKQAIAIGLSKARHVGVNLPPPKTGSEKNRKQAQRDTAKARKGTNKRTPSRTRSRATTNALRREGAEAGSHRALSNQTQSSARRRSAASRSQAAHKAVGTKGRTGLRNEAMKAARSRERRRRAS
jgi:hypothetical protein